MAPTLISAAILNGQRGCFSPITYDYNYEVEEQDNHMSKNNLSQKPETEYICSFETGLFITKM